MTFKIFCEIMLLVPTQVIRRGTRSFADLDAAKSLLACVWLLQHLSVLQAKMQFTSIYAHFYCFWLLTLYAHIKSISNKNFIFKNRLFNFPKLIGFVPAPGISTNLDLLLFEFQFHKFSKFHFWFDMICREHFNF